MKRHVGRIARFAMLSGVVFGLGACDVGDGETGDEERVAGVASELDEGVSPPGDDDDDIPDAEPGNPFVEVPSPPGCYVTVAPAKELLIRHLGVVEDPVRTRWVGRANRNDPAPGDGAWTFGRLMTNMAGPNDPETFVRKWLARWEEHRTVNGFMVPARPRIKSLIDQWPKTSAGELDLTRSPMRLLAIVNRMDLRNLRRGNAGEGRFVFGVTDASGRPLEFTVILEYKLPAATLQDAQDWARRWHALGDLTPGTEEYNAALQKITDRFTRRDANPLRPNGSAIGQVRTNEIALGGSWELREFRLNTAGNLVSATVRQTPSPGQRRAARLARWIKANESNILRGRYSLPREIEYEPIRGGRAVTDFAPTNPPGVAPDTRHSFAVNTCDGCHGGETGTGFLHITNRSRGEVAALSGFLTGTTAIDPVSGQERRFDDLARRRSDFRAFLCAGTVAPAGGAARVH